MQAWLYSYAVIIQIYSFDSLGIKRSFFVSTSKELE